MVRLVTIRPIRTDDSGMEQEFIRSPVERIPLLPLHGIVCGNCRRRSSSFIYRNRLRPAHGLLSPPSCAKIKNWKSAWRVMYTPKNPGSCEFGVTVDDAWQGSGVARVADDFPGRLRHASTGSRRWRVSCSRTTARCSNSRRNAALKATLLRVKTILYT